jgi:ribose transport system permease protein
MHKKELGLLVLILVVGAVTAALNPRFLSPVNLVNMANLIGLFGLFSIGVGLVIITGGIDLSVGSMFALIGVVFIDLGINRGVPWQLVLPIAILIGVALGSIHGFLVTRLKMQPFVVTLCGLLIYRGVARWYMNDATIGFGYGDEFATLSWLASGRTLGIPHTFITLVIVSLVMAVVLHRSVYGRYLFAVGKNEEAARFSGINADLVTATAYIISGGWPACRRSSSPSTRTR